MNPVSIQKELSARFKLAVSMVGILFFVFVLMFLVVWRQYDAVIEDDINRRVSTIPTILALANQKEILENDIVNLQDGLNAIIEQISKTAEIQYLFVLNTQGVPLAEEYSNDLMPDKREALREILFKASTETADGKSEDSDVDKIMEKQKNMQTNAQKMYKSPHRVRMWVKGQEIIEVFFPVTKAGTNFGAIRAGFTPVAHSKMSTTRNFMIVIMVFSLAIALAVSLFLGGHLTDSTIRIVDETEKDITYRLQREFKKKMEKIDEEPTADDARSNIPTEAAQLSKEEFFALLDISKQIHATLNYEEVLHLAVNSVVRLLKIRELTIFLMDEDQSTLTARIGYNISGMIPEEDLNDIKVSVGHGDIGVAAQFGSTNIVDEPKPGTAIVSALVTRGVVIGTIIVRNKISGKPFGNKDKFLVRQANVIIANALENARLYEGAKNS